MHPRLLEGIDYIQATRAELIASFDGVSSDRLHARRNPGEWSAAQVIEHLRIVEGGIARLFAKRIAQAKAAGLRHEDSTQSILGGLDDVADTLQYGKIDAPDTVKPPEEVDLDSAVAGLATTRAALIDAVSGGDGLALGDIKHTHPILGELDFYQWLIFVGAHEARHTRQIRRVLGS